MTFSLGWKIAVAAVVAALCNTSAFAQKAYDPGASDTEIRIGNISPYSGPASPYSTIAKAEAGYFKMINERGGINGRKINFISYDDAYSPPKTVEQARKLVESDEVLLLFANVGTPGNTAIQRYLNSKKVPQLLNLSGADKWADPAHFPWTMGFLPSYRAEARIYASYILSTEPNARIGVLYQNDDFGKEYVAGLREGLLVGFKKHMTGVVGSEDDRMQHSPAGVVKVHGKAPATLAPTPDGVRAPQCRVMAARPSRATLAHLHRRCPWKPSTTPRCSKLRA